MAKVLFVWEQGSDLGHLSQLRLAVVMALEQGHRVYLAARHLHRVPEIWQDLPVTCLQAPFKQTVAKLDQSAFPSFTHLLAHSCFSSVQELQMLLKAWCALYDLIEPELVLFEHSPTALIAAYSYTFGKIIVGNGFTIPPQPTDSSTPFAPFLNMPDTPQVRDGLLHDDAEVLKLINLSLKSIGVTELPKLHDIYAQADARFLMTWTVLDHFGDRPGERYLGVELPAKRSRPLWPDGEGARVFGYLHAVPGIERLLHALVQRKDRAILLVRNLPDAVKAQFANASIRFTDELQDLGAIAHEAHWVINHGNHSTVATFLRYGVPQLIVPLHQEHLLMGLRLLKLECAVVAYQDQSSYQEEMALVSTPAMRQRALEAARFCPDAATTGTVHFIQNSIEQLSSR